MTIGTPHVIRGVLAVSVLSVLACTRPSPDSPGVEQQPRQHPERSPATQHTVPPEPHAIPAEESRDNPDSLGTVRTPPSAPARPMDERPEDSLGAALDPSASQR